MALSQNETDYLTAAAATTADGSATGLAPATATLPQVPTSLLENLATRLRPSGLCLVLLQADGSIGYHDAAAGAFFQRFVVPLLRLQDCGGRGGDSIKAKLAALNTGSPMGVWNCLPGIAAAAFPLVERRQLIGAVLLMGRSMTFDLGEDVVRACGRLSLDATWLGQQANDLPAYSDDAIQRQARLLLSMVRDQVRLGGLEQELTSLSNQLADTYEELSLIYQISGGMRINRRPVDFFKQACLDAIDVMGVRGMGVALTCADKLGQEPVVYGPLTLPPPAVSRVANELLGWMKTRKTSLLINDLSKDRKLAWLAPQARRLLAVPLQRGDEVLGVMFGVDKAAGDFDSVDSKLLNSIANESAIYLENAILFEDVHGLMMGLLHSLTSAVDAKDAYTCGHSERVAMLSKVIAAEAGLSENEVERVYMAGLLHDVGKIGVPESVLQKPGRLTPEEFEQMKKHPAIGARILQDVKQIQDIIPGVLHHHERYDGKGYPDGLAGQDIPLMGRIICLADSFDAMTSTRTYRKAMPLEVTLADIRRCSGTQFDPTLTEAFLRLGREKLNEVLRMQDASPPMELTPQAIAPAAPATGTGKAA